MPTRPARARPTSGSAPATPPTLAPRWRRASLGAALAAVVLVLTLSACGGEGSGDASAARWDQARWDRASWR